jgi:hypothetical protein
MKCAAITLALTLSACSGGNGADGGPSESEITNQAKELTSEADKTVNATIAKIEAEAAKDAPQQTNQSE